MEDEIMIDYTKPVLDITYDKIQTLKPQETAEETRAIILTGNPIDDFAFLRLFPNLQLIHGDSMGLNDFQDLKIHLLTKLQHIILRINQLNNFEHLQQSESLLTLDVSQNPFQEKCEQNFSIQLPSLKRLHFGCATINNQNNNYISNSKTRLNTFSLFTTFFINRFYFDEQIYFADNDKCQIDNILFILTAINNKLDIQVKRTSETKIKNQKIVLTFYSIIAGYEISETKQQILHLQDFMNDQFDASISENFEAELVQYPTQISNKNIQDNEIFQLLETRKYDQINMKQNFNAVTIEFNQKVIIFVFDKHSNEFVDFMTIQSQIQKQITNLEGLKVKLQKTQENSNYKTQQVAQDGDEENDQFFLRNKLAFSDPLPLQYHTLKLNNDNEEVNTVNYYISSKNRNEIIVLCQDQIQLLTKQQYSSQRVLDLLTCAFRQASRDGRYLIDEADKQYIYITINTLGLQIPIKIEMLFKQYTIGNKGFFLNNFTYQHYIMAQINFKDGNNKIIFTEYPVRYVPRVTRVELVNQNNVLFSNIFELVEGQLKKSNYKNFQFIYYLNNQKIKETTEPFIDLLKENIDFHGLFKVILTIKDENGCFVGDEIESQALYIRHGEDIKNNVNFKVIDNILENPKVFNNNDGLIEIETSKQNTVKKVTQKKKSDETFINKQTISQQRQDETIINKGDKNIVINKQNVNDEEPSLLTTTKILDTSPTGIKSPVQKQQVITQPDERTKRQPDGAFQPLQYRIPLYSAQIDKSCVLEFCSTVSNAAPIIKVFNKFNSTNNTGLMPSYADMQAVNQDNYYRVTIKYDKADIGKLIYLYVHFEKQIYQLIPVTYQPVVDESGECEQNVQFDEKPILINFGSKIYQQISLSANNDNIYLNTSGKKQIQLLLEETEAVPINKDILYVDIFNSQVLREPQSLMLESVQMNYYNTLLWNNFSGVLGDNTLFTPQAASILKKLDKANIVDNNPEVLAALSYRNYCFLLAFTSEQQKQLFCWKVQAITKKLFHKNYICEASRNQISQSNDFSQIVKISQQQYLQQLANINFEIIYKNVENKQITYAQFQVGYEIDLQDKRCQFLLGDNTYIAFIGKNYNVYKTMQVSGIKGDFIPSNMDLGMKVILINGQLQRFVNAEAAEPNEFVLTETQEEEDDLYDIIVKGEFSEKLEVFDYTTGVYEQATLDVNKKTGKISLKTKANVNFTGLLSSTYAFQYQQDICVVLSNEMYNVLLRCADEQQACDIFIYFGVDRCHWYFDESK